MTEIKVITELCAEDRARLDRLTEALEKNAPNCASCAKTVATYVATAVNAAHEEPKNEPQEPAKVETPATTPAEDRAPWDPIESFAQHAEKPTEEPAEPSVTLAQIQQKVVQLCAAFDGTKKADVRRVINEYGARVSDLKDQPDKWDEVWAKLTALEG